MFKNIEIVKVLWISEKISIFVNHKMCICKTKPKTDYEI